MNTRNRIVLPSTVPEPSPKVTGVVRISPDAEMVVRRLQAATRMDARSIVSEILIQAESFIEIQHIGPTGAPEKFAKGKCRMGMLADEDDGEREE